MVLADYLMAHSKITAQHDNKEITLPWLQQAYHSFVMGVLLQSHQ
jgi:hypothetical protein